LETVFAFQIVKLYTLSHIVYLVVILALYWLKLFLKFMLNFLHSSNRNKKLKMDEYTTTHTIRAPTIPN